MYADGKVTSVQREHDGGWFFVAAVSRRHTSSWFIFLSSPVQCAGACRNVAVRKL